MCTKSVNNYSSTIKLVLECYKIQKMCNKAVNYCFFLFYSVVDRYKTQEMCDKAVDNYAHALKFFSDQYNTQKCVMKLLIIFLLQYNLFLNEIILIKIYNKAVNTAFFYFILC